MTCAANWIFTLDTCSIKQIKSVQGKTISLQLTVCSSKYLSIIGQGQAKYRDLSVASRSIIC